MTGESGTQRRRTHEANAKKQRPANGWKWRTCDVSLRSPSERGYTQIGTGLLTYAAHVASYLVFPSRNRAVSVGGPGQHSRRSMVRTACAFTVAGQWRNLTALPEHSVTG